MVSVSQYCSSPACEQQWYALYVKPRHEKKVAQQLRARDYKEFLPLYKSRRHWSDRFKEVSLPLFPRYTFCRFEIRNRLPILKTPGVVSIVGFARQAAPIDDREIEAIRAIVGSGLPASPHPFLKAGQRVRLVTGPLNGLEGIFVAQKGHVRIVVSIEILQRSVAVEIDRTWILPFRAKPAARAADGWVVGRNLDDFGADSLMNSETGERSGGPL